jgi:hypothetical protein
MDVTTTRHDSVWLDWKEWCVESMHLITKEAHSGWNCTGVSSE